MASLYARDRSPYWWVEFIDQKSGKRTCKSTGFRRDDPFDHKKARALEAELAAKEFNKKIHHGSEQWDAWVSTFLKRHCKSPKTLSRYELAWSWISIYLKERRILMPIDLTYQDALGYLKWRTSYRKRGGRTVKQNTALNDMKVLRIIMGQAIRLGYCVVNPCNRLGVAKEETKEKPELTDADIQLIRVALIKRERWMQISFEIALHTGCRQSETQIALTEVDFTRKTITFASPKGGRSRAFSVPLPSAIEPMLLELKNAGAKNTLNNPPRMLSKHWWQFFKADLNRPDLCFHCTRVTFVTRLARAGVPLSAAMRLVNHSSTLVHAIYQRLGVDDVRHWGSLIAIPPS
jgi:site-specific recombinase XerD